jgi:hypothetical protein
MIASANICFLRNVRTFSVSFGLPVILDFDASFCRWYKSWYLSRSFLAREILDLSRAAECVSSAGGKLLEIKLNSRIDESRRASVILIITKPSFLNPDYPYIVRRRYLTRRHVPLMSVRVHHVLRIRTSVANPPF